MREKVIKPGKNRDAESRKPLPYGTKTGKKHIKMKDKMPKFIK